MQTETKPKGKNKYWTLFLSTLTISAFTFGGGYVIVCDGKILAGISLPVGGLMSDKPTQDLQKEQEMQPSCCLKLFRTRVSSQIPSRTSAGGESSGPASQLFPFRKAGYPRQ